MQLSGLQSAAWFPDDFHKSRPCCASQLTGNSSCERNNSTPVLTGVSSIEVGFVYWAISVCLCLLWGGGAGDPVCLPFTLPLSLSPLERLSTPSPPLPTATFPHKPSASVGPQSSSGSALCSTQEHGSLSWPPTPSKFAPLPPGRKDRFDVNHLQPLVHELSPPSTPVCRQKHWLKRVTSEFDPALHSFKTLSSPGFPATFATAPGGEEGGAITLFYRWGKWSEAERWSAGLNPAVLMLHASPYHWARQPGQRSSCSDSH